MNCMKCGRETTGEQVFCDTCLQTMAKYPVKPGIAVKLPQRRDPSAYRRSIKRRTVNPEEQLRILKKRARRLTLALLLCIALIALLLKPALSHLLGDHYKKGQNYSVITTPTTEPTGTTAP